MATNKIDPAGLVPCNGCIDCIMAYLLFGDGAICLAGHGAVYWVGRSKWTSR